MVKVRPRLALLECEEDTLAILSLHRKVLLSKEVFNATPLVPQDRFTWRGRARKRRVEGKGGEGWEGNVEQRHKHKGLVY